jgi:hypothetical protein
MLDWEFKAGTLSSICLCGSDRTIGGSIPQGSLYLNWPNAVLAFSRPPMSLGYLQGGIC